MKTWRSYDGTVTLSWLCVVFFVAALREASLSDDASIVQLAYGVMVAAVAVAVLAIYLGMRMKRRVEDKVRTSDVILVADIQVLAKANSQLLEDAIALHCSQMEQGSSPGE